jgi:hypothetical protein
MNSTPSSHSVYLQGRTILAMWGAIAAAPLAWVLHLNVAYLLAALVCTPALAVWLYGFTLLMLAIAVVGAVACGRLYRRTAGPAQDDPAAARTHFLVGTGLLGSVLFILAIIAQTVPMTVYPPC